MTLRLAACLLLAASLAGGCMDLSSEDDFAMAFDISKVTYFRQREATAVNVKVANPAVVFRYESRIIDTDLILTGTRVYRMKFGDVLRSAAPLVWNKYLDVRVGSEEKLPTIEMEVTNVTGAGVYDLSGLGSSRSANDLSLTLVCRFISADGRSVAQFSSVKSFSESRAPKDGNLQKAAPGLIPQAFDDILAQFFSSDGVLAALAEGAREYRLTHGSAERAPPAAPAIRPLDKRFAVVVGVGKYQHAGKAGLTDLAYADDDANAFASLLKKQGWSDSHIKLLTDKQATQRNVLVALESWLTKAGPDDLIVLFWSGHGFPDPEDPEKIYFACHDTDLSIPATGYRMDKVRRALEERKARNVVVLADTCHAGKLITRGDGKGVYVAKFQKDKKIPKGWIFMVASESDRKAIEHSSWSNGAFTHCLLEALGGKADGYQSVGRKDGVVTMLELRTYLSSVMPEKTQKVLGVAKRPIITTSTGDSNIWNLNLKGR